MKLVYISHPLRGDIESNKQKVNQICESFIDKNIIPISPIHAFSFYDIEADQSIVLEWCLALLEVCDEIWVYGDWESSEGCRLEVGYAIKNNICIKFKEIE